MSGRIRISVFAIHDAIYAQAIITISWAGLLVMGAEGFDIAVVMSLIVLQLFHFLSIRDIRKDLTEIDAAKQRSQEAQRMEA